jgi:SsrA-binding protein
VSKKQKDHSPRIVNRRAHHDYEILEKIETGISLLGSEVKSVRNGQVSLAEGFARVDPATMGLYLHDVDIARYDHAGPRQHEPKRVRTLLAHKRQIEKLLGATSTKGTTIVPLAMYFSRGWIKVELGLGRGKRQFDKRQDLKTREAKQQIQRAMSRKRP